MKTGRLLTIIFSILLNLPSLAQQPAKTEQRQRISLAGTWHCKLGNIQLPGTVDESKLAPAATYKENTGQLTRLHPFTGKIIYTREFVITGQQAHKEWRLIMERTKPSTVWVDEDSIGSNQTILSPQVYTIGRLKAGKHQLRILIDNSNTAVPNGIQGSHAWTDATQTNWNGVIGRFELEAHEGMVINQVQVYPQTGNQYTDAILEITSDISGMATLSVKGHTWNTAQQLQLPAQKIQIELVKGTQQYPIKINTGQQQVLWSEFNPALYKAYFELACNNKKDYTSISFGIRDFKTSGTQFTINQQKTMLRGKHDACVFPLTGYPPMEKKIWKQQFRIAKSYGINHYRFHSWTPPQAAFDAANEEGIYMQPELPYWGQMHKDSTILNSFLMQEGGQILQWYGNNPSFVMMALGNELGGDAAGMRILVDQLRNADNRRLYAAGSNNNLGTAAQQPGDDFFVTCRVGGNVGVADYSTHSRSSFSFADAKNGGLLNGSYPTTNKNFAVAVAKCTVPVVSHENGQFQIYPDYNEIKKYTGVLYPYNLEIFRKRLAENHLQHQATAFHRTTGKFAALCYKADIEMCLRTPGFGGFQLLDLQDYPGQGSAYVGLLDAFMDSKNIITPKVFQGFCGQIVPLALIPKHCWYNNEVFTANIQLSNYSSTSLQTTIQWTISTVVNNQVIANGDLPVTVQQGSLTSIGNIDYSLNKLLHPTQIRLRLIINGIQNQYDIWVYPENKIIKTSTVVETTSLNDAITLLNQGKKVLLIPDTAFIAHSSVGGMFTPDYWNYAMFKNISEHLKRDVSPGTLSILTNPKHPLFNYFPTDSFSNWQWWIISHNSRPMILNETPAHYTPLVQVIDNIERNHKLGILFEMRVGKGSLLVSTCQLNNILEKPEGRAFKQAIISYMESGRFAPESAFTQNELEALFSATTKQQNIKAVKNVTSYQ